ncbi:hypothetical protein [Thermoanaerobacterium thermosulfurigenes]|uniref:hypothetical protein n=1 Tax=Thermoanaerobacterium thermosulfurigenes TaxID=33950 RepID=UPI003F49BB6D
MILLIIYSSIFQDVEIYEKLFQEYKLLHDYFGRGANDVMKRLKNIKEVVSDVREPKTTCI